MYRNKNTPEPELYSTHQKVRLLKILGQMALEEICKEIEGTNLENKEGIKKSLQMKVTIDSVKIWSEHPSFYLDQGVAPHKMRYINNRVIPIQLSDARKVYPKDIRAGVAFRTIKKYAHHPGYEALNFVSKGLEKAQDRFQKEVLRQFLSKTL